MFGARRLPSPCACGFTGAQRQPCTEVGLRNHVSFPPFADIPDESDVDLGYYEEKGGYLSPKRHWCLVGEITDVSHFVRPRADIRTRFGETTRVHFYLEDAPRPAFFDWPALRTGHTLCVLYPCARTFMDMTAGVRQESASTVMVFPASLDRLTAEVGALVGGRPSRCVVCDKSCARDTRCGQCRVMLYCSRECQRGHWTSGHRALCGHSETLASLAGFDFSEFADFQDWSFSRAPVSAADRDRRMQRSCQEEIAKMCPGRSLGPVRQMLESIADTPVLDDEISGPTARASSGRMIKEFLEFFQKPLKSTFLFGALLEFCEAQAKDPSKRVHVVDLGAHSCPPRETGSTAEFLEDLLFTTVLLSLPQWQHSQKRRADIAWSLEAHQVLSFQTVFEDPDWNMMSEEGVVDICTVRHKKSDVTAVFSDNMGVVADLGRDIAGKRPGCLVLRVLRATANQTYANQIRTIATTKTPSNVFTLWVREDVAVCGRFRAPRPDLPLAEQLLDSRPFDVADLMANMRCHDGPPPQGVAKRAGGRKAKASAGPAGRQCRVCGTTKDLSEFTKTQRGKPAGQQKCIACTK